MQKVTLLALFCLSFFYSVGQNILEAECYLSFEQREVTATPLATFYNCQKSAGKIRFTTLGIVTPKWGEGLIGATWFPTSNLAVGNLVGIETAPKLLRSFTYIRFTPAKWFILGGMESSLSDIKKPWYRIEARYEFAKNFWVGATVRRRFGSGVRFQWQKEFKNGNTLGFHMDGVYNWENNITGNTLGLFFVY